ALETTERFFWQFCDDYLELVKERAYDEDGGLRTESAQATLATALHTVLRLLAPFLPYVTEEVWSWWQEGSIHHAPWPRATDLGSAGASDSSGLEAVAAALAGVRGVKSQAKVSMRAELVSAEITGNAAALKAIGQAEADLKRAGRIVGEVTLTEQAGATEVSV